MTEGKTRGKRATMLVVDDPLKKEADARAEERAAIVAWLRGPPGNVCCCCAECEAIREEAARAIERGEHLHPPTEKKESP